MIKIDEDKDTLTQEFDNVAEFVTFMSERKDLEFNQKWIAMFQKRKEAKSKWIKQNIF